ncbi:BA75_03982T0 [Komagataella pastoris]|uniref:BA75_03982T0 n=1 Tax=Komagataella pastoris TaxID=4922 RepID=A0A1B2JGJ6_PICPA|nr:BA75_03982T0 [Komagataella pastoris]
MTQYDVPRSSRKFDEKYEKVPLSGGSFTSFRLAYCSPVELWESSRVLFLGPVPLALLEGYRSKVFRTLLKHNYHKSVDNVKSQFDLWFQDTTQYSEHSNSPPGSSSKKYDEDCRELLGHWETEDGESEEDTQEHSTLSQIDQSTDSVPLSTSTGKEQLESNLQFKNKAESSRAHFEPDLPHKHILQPQKLEGPSDGKACESLPGAELTGYVYREVFHTKFAKEKERLSSSDMETFATAREDFENVDSNTRQIETENASSFRERGTSVRFESHEKSNWKRKGVIQEVFPIPEMNESLIRSHLNDSDYGLLNRLKEGLKNRDHQFKRSLVKMSPKLHLKRIFAGYERGQIMKLEKMLVLVKETSVNIPKSALFEVTELEPYDTRVVQRWKEYIVGLRSINNEEDSVMLQFYSKRSIDKIEEINFTRNNLDFKMNHYNTKVALYNTLDKTLSVCTNAFKDRPNRIYILKCRTRSSSTRWLSLLNTVLGKKKPDFFSISLPALNISIDMFIPPDTYRRLLNESLEFESSSRVFYKEKGYAVKPLPFLEYMGKLVIGSLKDMKNQKIINAVESFSELLNFGFTFRNYDRLEWFLEEDLKLLYASWPLCKTHVLEMRKLEHYPREVESNQLLLHEPSPLEGFLVRLSSRSSRKRTGFLSRPVYKLEYFFTNDNLLFFSRYYKAVPPLRSFRVFMAEEQYMNDDSLEDLASRDEVYEHCPYPLDDEGHIKWLKPGASAHTVQEGDLKASNELKRRIIALMKTESAINLCDVVEVVPVPSSRVPAIVSIAKELTWKGIFPKTTNQEDNTSFELVLSDNARVMLSAATTSVRDLWVTKLSELIQYWKLRKRKDTVQLFEMCEKNLKTLKIPRNRDQFVPNGPIWESSRGEAHAKSYNISHRVLSRSLVMSGILYQKPKKHANFKKYFIVLCSGYLILFHIYKRGFGAKAEPTAFYSHYLSIPIKNCYVYSGTNTSLDLLSKSLKTEVDTKGSQGVPLLHCDGWYSIENASSRCFTLWFGTKRLISGNVARKMEEGRIPVANGTGSVRNPGIIRTASRLGVTGNSMVFMAKSRQEKDMWVTRIINEIEKLSGPLGEQLSIL